MALAAFPNTGTTMDKNFKLTIAYDGTRYHGWQRQPNGPTIQSEIETAVQTMTRQAIRLTGSGRTDAGVHAKGQVANFACNTRISPTELMKGLNSILPDDIVIRHCCLAPLEFHARYDVTSKIYRYHIANQPIRPVIRRHFAWWIRTPLNIDAMRVAADHLLGKHDFKSFEGAGSPRSHTTRTVLSADVARGRNGRIQFTIAADGFLRYMVRNIVGSLAAVGLNTIDASGFADILATRDRSKAAATAPPNGLFLMKVCYPE
jgi:tRNA pseudouridine38-40 synthase